MNTTQVAQRVARQMVDRALTNAVRPDVPTIADMVGLPTSEVDRIVTAATQARRPAMSQGMRAQVLLHMADRLTHEAAVLRRLAHDLPVEPSPGSGPVCDACGRVFANTHALNIHRSRKHKEPAA